MKNFLKAQQVDITLAKCTLANIFLIKYTSFSFFLKQVFIDFFINNPSLEILIASVKLIRVQQSTLFLPMHYMTKCLPLVLTLYLSIGRIHRRQAVKTERFVIRQHRTSFEFEPFVNKNCRFPTELLAFILNLCVNVTFLLLFFFLFSFSFF